MSGAFWLDNSVLRVELTGVTQTAMDHLDQHYDKEDYKRSPPDYVKAGSKAWLEIYSRGESVYTAGSFEIRPSGNNSLRNVKRSIKIKLSKRKRLFGMRRLNFKSMWSDPSLLREWLVWRFAARIGVVAPRMRHAEVWINGVFRGLFAMVENVDVHMVEHRFHDQDSGERGNLYKGAYRDLDVIDSMRLGHKVYSGASLEFRGHSGKEYVADRRRSFQTYALKMKRDPGDRRGGHDDLAYAIAQITRLPQSRDYAEQFDAVFNTDSFFRYLALCAIVGSWDSYPHNANNIAWYDARRNYDRPRFEWIAWDMDHTLGNDYHTQPDWLSADPFRFSPRFSRACMPPVDRMTFDATLAHNYVGVLYDCLGTLADWHWETALREQHEAIKRLAHDDFEQIAQPTDGPRERWQSRPWTPAVFDTSLDMSVPASVTTRRRVAGIVPWLRARLERLEHELVVLQERYGVQQ